MKDKYFEILLKLITKCKKTGDVPVSALIVKDNKIISKSYNERIKKYKTTNHAEIIALEKANKKLKKYYLYDCDMYVTLKPCEMCQKVINNARIRNVFYLIDKPNYKKEYSKTKYNEFQSNLAEKYTKILHDFFNNMR